MLFGQAPLTGAHVVSVVGSGGKTSLLAALARELPGTVALTTTTHILPFRGMPTVTGGTGEVDAAFGECRVACVGRPTDDGKLTGSPEDVERLAVLTDHVLVEADGSRQLPLKAHAGWEPAVPACADACILVVGASGLGQPIEKVVHRPGLFCSRADCWEDDLASPDRVAQVIASEKADGLLSFDRLLVNQVRDDRSRQAALALVRALRARGIDVPAELTDLPRP